MDCPGPGELIFGCGVFQEKDGATVHIRQGAVISIFFFLFCHPHAREEIMHSSRTGGRGERDGQELISDSPMRVLCIDNRVSLFQSPFLPSSSFFLLLSVLLPSTFRLAFPSYSCFAPFEVRPIFVACCPLVICLHFLSRLCPNVPDSVTSRIVRAHHPRGHGSPKLLEQ